ncbi:MAG TPA: hypothetical protein VLG47_04380 [Candidatus Saccharimonadales bacterium]|nr:hypothetical protein [Candidatus Saccharimonadales bacterium]
MRHQPRSGGGNEANKDQHPVIDGGQFGVVERVTDSGDHRRLPRSMRNPRANGVVEAYSPWRLTRRGQLVSLISVFALAGTAAFIAIEKPFSGPEEVAGCELTVPLVISGTDTGFTEFGFATQLAGRGDPRDVEGALSDVNPTGIPAGNLQPGQTVIKIPQEYCKKTSELYPGFTDPIA